MKNNTLFLFCLLSLVSLFSVEATTLSAPVAGQFEQKELSSKKSRKRHVGKAAQQKRKALREQGVRGVRAKSPSGWPDKVPVPEDTSLQAMPKQNEYFVYKTNNYIFLTPVELDKNACDTVGRLFECACAANKAVAEILPVPRTEGNREERPYYVELCPSRSDYYQKNGPKNSNGVFKFALKKVPALAEEDIAADMVMVPFDSLGLNSSGAVEKEDIETHTLVHELTHQNFVLNNLPIWCNEGWAEYIGHVPYVGEDLDFTRCFAVVLNQAQKRAGYGALNFSFTLEDFLTMEQGKMYAYMEQGKDTYTLATMLITYFVHMDGKRGISALRNYMQALADGASHREAVSHLITPYRNARTFQKSFCQAWKRKKVIVELAEVE